MMELSSLLLKNSLQATETSKYVYFKKKEAIVFKLRKKEFKSLVNLFLELKIINVLLMSVKFTDSLLRKILEMVKENIIAIDIINKQDDISIETLELLLKKTKLSVNSRRLVYRIFGKKFKIEELIRIDPNEEWAILVYSELEYLPLHLLKKYDYLIEKLICYRVKINLEMFEYIKETRTLDSLLLREIALNPRVDPEVIEKYKHLFVNYATLILSNLNQSTIKYFIKQLSNKLEESEMLELIEKCKKITLNFVKWLLENTSINPKHLLHMTNNKRVINYINLMLELEN